MTLLRWAMLIVIAVVVVVVVVDITPQNEEHVFGPRRSDPQAPLVQPNPSEPIPDAPEEMHLIGRPPVCGNAGPPPLQRTLGSPEADRIAQGSVGMIGGVHFAANGFRLRHTALQRRYGWDYWVGYPSMGNNASVPAFGAMYRVNVEVGDAANGHTGSVTLRKREIHFAEPADTLSPHGLAIPYRDELTRSLGDLAFAPPGAEQYYHLSVLDVTPQGVATVSVQYGHDETTQETKAISKGQVLVLRDTGFRILSANPRRLIHEQHLFPMGWLELDPQPLTVTQLNGTDQVRFALRSTRRPSVTDVTRGKRVRLLSVSVMVALVGLGLWGASRYFRKPVVAQFAAQPEGGDGA